MTKNLCLKLVKLLEEELDPIDYVDQRTVRLEERLFITLRYLATGRFCIQGLDLPYVPSEREIREWILEISEGINCSMSLIHPNEEGEWMEIATKFQLKTKFPHCVGVVDARYIYVKRPLCCVPLLTIVNADGELIIQELLNMEHVPSGQLFHESIFYDCPRDIKEDEFPGKGNKF